MVESTKKKNTNIAPSMTGLLDIVSPPGLNFRPKQIEIGEVYARSLVITAYPSELGPGWLSKITSMPGVTVTMHSIPTDAFTLVNQIKVTMGEAESRMDTGNNVTRRRADKQFKDSELLLKKIDEEQQKVFNVVVVILVSSADEEILSIRVRNVEQRLAGMGMRGRVHMNKQEEAFYLPVHGPS